MAPTFADVHAAALRIAPFVHRTPVMTSRTLDEWLDTRVFLKCEHLQRVGAFKYRGATNAVQRLTPEGLARVRPTVEALAAVEGLPAHAKAVQR